MIERENNFPNSIEQQASELLDRIHGTELGSTEYHAATDYIDWRDLDNTIHTLRDNVTKQPESSSGSNYWQSELRIGELRMALLTDDIRKKSAHMPGYESTFYRIRSIDDDLGTESCEVFISAVKQTLDNKKNEANLLDNAPPIK
jgi:hypothetical protein